MTDAERELELAPLGAPLPGYDFIGMWRTGPASALVAIEVWGRRVARSAIVRLISGAASQSPKPMNAGTVTAGGTDSVLVMWTDKARLEFGEAFLDHQEAETTRLLANRWGTT